MAGTIKARASLKGFRMDWFVNPSVQTDRKIPDDTSESHGSRNVQVCVKQNRVPYPLSSLFFSWPTTGQN